MKEEKSIKEIMDLPLIKMMKEMHWNIALPAGGGPKDDKKVHGMIIGEQSYIDYILKHLE